MVSPSFGVLSVTDLTSTRSTFCTLVKVQVKSSLVSTARPVMVSTLLNVPTEEPPLLLSTQEAVLSCQFDGTVSVIE